MVDALDEFHSNKEVFINLGARINEDFNFEKLHSFEHYADSIRRFGTTDNYNTEASERLHIDYAKDAYRATNKKEFLEQMTQWLDRRERMAAFDLIVQWRRGEMPKPRTRRRRLLPPGVHLAKNPSARAVPFSVLQDRFGAMRFKDALEGFIAKRLQPTAYRREGTVAHSVNILQGLEAVDVWRVKFAVPDVQVDTEHTVLHRRPKGTRGIGELDGRFDTVLVNDSEGEGVETGIEGASP
jgi:hypothetical protein